MGKIFRTIKYGSTKTRTLMLAILLLLLGGIGIAAAGIFTGSLIMMLAGAGAVLIAAVLYFACFENALIDDMASEDGEAADDAELTAQGDAADRERNAGAGRREAAAADRERNAETDRREVAAADREGNAGADRREAAAADREGNAGAGRREVASSGGGRTESGSAAVPDRTETDGSVTEGSKTEKRRGAASEEGGTADRESAVSKKDRKAENRRSADTKESVEATEADKDDEFTDTVSGPEAGEERTRRRPAEIEVINNAHGLKKLLRKYKIKNYVPVVIDSSRSMAVSKTPAFCWERKGAFNFLLLEAEARTVSLTATEFLHVTYQRNVPEDEPEAYEALRELPQDVFAAVLPTFNTEIGRMGQTIYTKNLYVLGRDVAVTPRSMRELRKKYRFKYRIFESLDISGDYSDYFKKAYEARVMWTDNVISQKEYQEQISEILQKMAEDDDIIKYDFLDNLDLMIRHRLITDEFAAYYKARRSERELKAMNRKPGKKR